MTEPRPIKIQDDYWTGTDCLTNEVPWIVPGAVHLLDRLVRPDDIVLDLGSGGSTLFYAARCKFVIAIETNPDWAVLVRKNIESRGYTNVLHLLAQTQSDVASMIRGVQGADVVSVDTVHGYSRSQFLNLAAPKCRRVLVLDNYAAPELFDTHHDKSAEYVAGLLPGDGNGWAVSTFDDEHWCGKGTRLIYR